MIVGFIVIPPLLVLLLLSIPAAAIPRRGNEPWSLILCKFKDSDYEPRTAEWFAEWMSGGNNPDTIESYFSSVSNAVYTIKGSNVTKWLRLPWSRREVLRMALLDPRLQSERERPFAANFSKIEEMSTGAAYCQLTHLLFRDSINLRKVIWNSRNEMDHLNLRRLRKGLRQRRNECYPVCVSRSRSGLVLHKNAGRLLPPLFYDSAAFPAPNQHPHREERQPLPAGATGPTPSRPPSARTSKTTTTTSGVRAEKTSSNPTAPAYYRPFSVESSAMKALEVEISRLSKRYSEAIFADIAQTMKEERDSYLGRLRKIEELCNACAEGEDVRKDDILAILYEESGNGEGGDGQIAAVNNDDTFVSCSSKRSL